MSNFVKEDKPATAVENDLVPKNEKFGLNVTEEKGRCLVSKQDFDTIGTSILSTKAYAFSIFDKYKKRYCGVCLKKSELPQFTLHCNLCDSIYVCSANCLNELIANGHHLICRSLRRIATFKHSIHEKGVIKILLFLLKQRLFEKEVFKLPSFDGFQADENVYTGLKEIRKFLNDKENKFSKNALNGPNLQPNGNVSSAIKLKKEGGEDIDLTLLVKSPEKTNTLKKEENIVFNSNWEQMEELQSHYKNWLEDDKKEWKKANSFVFKIIEESQVLEDKKELLRILSDIEIQSKKNANTNKPSTSNTATFDLMEFHSCKPNCECIHDGLHITVKSIRKIKKGNITLDIHSKTFVLQGEDLTISYIDVNLPVQARRQKLKQEYFFICNCDRCVRESANTKSKQKIQYQQQKQQSPNLSSKQKRNSKSRIAGTLIEAGDNSSLNYIQQLEDQIQINIGEQSVQLNLNESMRNGNNRNYNQSGYLYQKEMINQQQEFLLQDGFQNFNIDNHQSQHSKQHSNYIHPGSHFYSPPLQPNPQQQQQQQQQHPQQFYSQAGSSSAQIIDQNQPYFWLSPPGMVANNNGLQTKNLNNNGIGVGYYNNIQPNNNFIYQQNPPPRFF
ncbi:hypothetical protein HK099_003091 [Clydaea vesicula]|uniref:SET domain-containing protein n=1 Tax=Clydaea vesicula TaxID=447962 RepID=A0AAD5Y0G1_9FUNG|nr:hypothetical protein HK099_003091 [Clydaea vesicula]